MDIKPIAEEVSEIIISKLNLIKKDDWTTLDIIRFVYLEMGSFLEKNTDFFLNDKLKNLKISDEVMYDIYEHNKINKAERKGVIQYQVICKSAAYFLKYVFDKLNIKSTYVHMTGEEGTIVHWFLVVQDDQEKQYFLTLAGDLPNIKNGFPTEHFGNHINYISELTLKPQYVIPSDCDFLKLRKRTFINSEGVEESYYEIDHELLCPPINCNKKERKEKYQKLKEIDTKIGYGRLYDCEELISPKQFYDLFIQFSEYESDVYKTFFDAFGLGDDHFELIDNITQEQVNKFKRNLNTYIANFLNTKWNIKNNNDPENQENFYKLYVSQLLNFEVDDIDNLFEFLKKNKKSKNSLSDEYRDIYDLILNILIIENRFDKFIIERNKKISGADFNAEAYNESKKNISIKNLKPLLNLVSQYTIKEKVKINLKGGYAPLEYLINKFTILFPLIFDCDYQVHSSDKILVTPFSLQGYSEQKKIINEMMEKIFYDLTISNCGNMPNYDDQRSPIDNRIRILPLRNKETSEYCIGFIFKGNVLQNEDERMIIYIPSENLLRDYNPLEERDKYLFVSSSIKQQLDDIENVDGNRHK